MRYRTSIARLSYTRRPYQTERPNGTGDAHATMNAKKPTGTPPRHAKPSGGVRARTPNAGTARRTEDRNRTDNKQEI